MQVLDRRPSRVPFVSFLYCAVFLNALLAMSTKQKHNFVTIRKKLEALSRFDEGEPLKKIAHKLGVETSTVSDWETEKRKKKKNRKKSRIFAQNQFLMTVRTI